MPRKQMNIGLTLEQRNRVDAVSAAEGTTPTEFARAAILEAVQLQHALTAEEREQVSLRRRSRGAVIDRVLPCGDPRSCCAGGTWSWCRCRWCRLFSLADGCTFCHTSWPRYPGIAWPLVGVAGVLRGSAMRWGVPVIAGVGC